jgi:hypothetical protein
MEAHLFIARQCKLNTGKRVFYTVSTDARTGCYMLFFAATQCGALLCYNLLVFIITVFQLYFYNEHPFFFSV